MKNNKNTKGIQTVRMKKNSVVNIAKPMELCDINDIEQYRVDKIPMSGRTVDIMDRLTVQNYMK